MSNIATKVNHEIFGTLTVITIDDKIYFIAKEIAEKLEYGKTQNLTDILDIVEIDTLSYRKLNEIKDLGFTPSPNGLTLINESGLYHAAFKSTKPEAVKFRHWVTEEVLPSIRKTGSYNANLPKTYLEAIKALVHVEEARLALESKNKELVESVEVLEEEKVKLEDKIETDKPKVNFVNQITPDCESLSIGDYAKLLSDQHNVKVGPNKLFEYLRDYGYLMIGRGDGEHNKPYAKYSNSGYGYFDLKYVNDGSNTTLQTLITKNGMLTLTSSIVDHFKNK